MHDRKNSIIRGLFIVALVFIFVFGVAYILRSFSQKSLATDMSFVAMDLAHKKMEQMLSLKANKGYSKVKSTPKKIVYSGRWIFMDWVNVNYVDPNNFQKVEKDMGLKEIQVTVAWGSGITSNVTLTALVSNQIPADIKQPLCPRCR